MNINTKNQATIEITGEMVQAGRTHFLGIGLTAMTFGYRAMAAADKSRNPQPLQKDVDKLIKEIREATSNHPFISFDSIARAIISCYGKPPERNGTEKDALIAAASKWRKKFIDTGLSAEFLAPEAQDLLKTVADYEAVRHPSKEQVAERDLRKQLADIARKHADAVDALRGAPALVD